MTPKKVVLAFSGGLDTSYCAKYLSEDLGYEVHAAFVHTGGSSPEELAAIQEKALNLGVDSYVTIEKAEEFYQSTIKYLVFGNVLKNGSYPLSVSAERVVQAIALAEYANDIGAAALAHGSTGAGNDQVRFDSVFQLLAPGKEIITPIRDQQLSREAEIDYLKAKGVQATWEKSKYSINKGLWGTSVGGAETLTSHLPLPEEAYPTPLSKAKPELVELEFSKGEVVGVNGKEVYGVEAIELIESIAAPFAIGRDIHVGDTIIGIKGRVGFEAAAAHLIIKAHFALEKHTLSKWQLFHKEQLSASYGMFLHESQFFDPVMRDVEAFLTSSQAKVSGKVVVKLLPYTFHIQGVESPNDLMQSKVASYGEENLAWGAEDVKGFIKVNGIANQLTYNCTNPQEEESYV